MFFYDEHLDLHINDTPLLSSSRVIEAARKVNVLLRWDNKGQMCGVSYDDSMALSGQLGIETLCVREFMSLAVRQPRVASSYFAEWLTNQYTLSKTGQTLDGQGNVIPVPRGRPDWFHLEDRDVDGLPTKLVNEKRPGMWKFWSPWYPDCVAGAMRSFVISSGTCSLDLGIPTFAKHPKIMIREYYRRDIEAKSSSLETLFKKYQHLIHTKDDAQIETFFDSLSISDITLGGSVDEFIHNKEREMQVDLVGKKRLLSSHFEQL